ncbi:uncharacterized protein LOC135809311 [Sycon ciliatum]|uniref:uncharacterized protein LOC135809311 n=1 Tax=Sycon ciliatum TaxID=27933 RepID=UPI0031F61777
MERGDREFSDFRERDRANVRRRRYDVAQLRVRTSDPDSPSPAERYQATIATELVDTWQEQHDIDQKWSNVKAAIDKSAASVLGFSRRRQPDWFREAESAIQPLLDERNRCYTDWLCSGQSRDCSHYTAFKVARSRARASISSARVDWIKAKAQAATESRFNGAVVWKCIHDLQSCTRGLAPVRTSAVLDENGNICSSPEEQSHRWGRHFDGVLNVASAWNRNALDDIPQRQEADHLAEAPTLREVSRAISRLQNGKSAGASGILPEMLKRGGPDLTAKLVELFGDVWRAGVVPQEWVDATLVPIPKKGDLSRCDNWRGISLLDVVGKVLASVIQTRLQSVAADFLPESQCGFRRGRSCTDMVFSVRQFLEKTIEHDCKGFFVFIDLKKAYDSVPRDCLWEVLSRAGIPAPMLAVIRSFHTDMSAVVRVENTTTDPIRVTNGLRQGCTMAPVLFNIFMWAVVTVWQRRVRDVPGVGFEFRHCDGDNNLYRKPTRTDPVAIATESQFADDSALFAMTRAGAETALAVFDTTAAEFGLKVSATKTQFLVAGRDVSPGDCAPIELAGTVIECVSEFRHLGSLIHRGGRSTQDITARIAHASRACGALQGTIFSNPDLDLHIKRDCWNNHTTNAQLLEMWDDSDTICVKVAQRRLEWLGHVARMDSSRMPRQILFGSLLTRRPAHGPRKRWKDCVVSDVRVRGLTKEWYPIACESRADWRTMYAEPVENVPQPDPVHWATGLTRGIAGNYDPSLAYCIHKTIWNKN